MKLLIMYFFPIVLLLPLSVTRDARILQIPDLIYFKMSQGFLGHRRRLDMKSIVMHLILRRREVSTLRH